MPLSLDRQALEAYLPHRGINILPDSLELNDTRSEGISLTRITANDPHGRRVFGRMDAAGACVWNEPFLGELMALTGVPLLAEALAAEGKVSVFSMISRVKYFRTAPMAGLVRGTTRIIRRRGEFAVFGCAATIDGEPLLEAEVMSGSAPLAVIAAGEAKPLRQADLGQVAEAVPGRAPSFTFLDRIRHCDAVAGQLEAAYSYPAHHPLVPGHFPNAPLMMGVTQWSAVAEAAVALARAQGVDRITVDGAIRREDGTEVLDARAVHLEHCLTCPCLATTARIAFRDVVRPGDGIVVSVRAS